MCRTGRSPCMLGKARIARIPVACKRQQSSHSRRYRPGPLCRTCFRRRRKSLVGRSATVRVLVVCVGPFTTLCTSRSQPMRMPCPTCYRPRRGRDRARVPWGCWAPMPRAASLPVGSIPRPLRAPLAEAAATLRTMPLPGAMPMTTRCQ